MTHRQIINRALLAAGEPAITGDLDDTKSTDAAVIAAYESSWREVLEANAWSDLLVGVVLEPVEESMDPDEVDGVPVTDSEGRYRYTLPAGATDVYEIEDGSGDAVSDWEVDSPYLYASADGIVAVLLFTGSYFRFAIPTDSVHVVMITNSLGSTEHASKRGSYLYSKQSELIVTYVSGDGLVPVDLDDIDSSVEPVMPSTVQDAVVFRLASQISFWISQNVDLQRSLDDRYHASLSRAMMNDMRPSGGESFWTDQGDYGLMGDSY